MGAEQSERRRLAEFARDRMVGSVAAALGDRLSVQPGADVDLYRDGVVVNSFGLLERCPRRAANPAEDFRESTFTARRRVGLAALRRVDDDASAAHRVAAAVDEVLGDGAGLSESLRAWLAALDRAGRAAVAAAAITWAVSVSHLVGTDPRIRWAGASASSRWNVPDRVVRLTATHDASTGGVVSGERLLLVADGSGGPTDRLRAGYLALVRALGTRHAPIRVTLAAPSRGELIAVPVDEDLLVLAADRVAEHVGLRVERDRAPAVPGRWCVHCHLLDVCPAGLTRSSGTDS